MRPCVWGKDKDPRLNRIGCTVRYSTVCVSPVPRGSRLWCLVRNMSVCPCVHISRVSLVCPGSPRCLFSRYGVRNVPTVSVVEIWGTSPQSNVLNSARFRVAYDEPPTERPKTQHNAASHDHLCLV